MQWVAVAFGGALGAVLRYAVALYIPFVPGKFPTATFLVNGLGSFLMGAFFVLIVEKGILPQYLKYLLMVGCFGALTTFSTFSMDALHLIMAGHWKMAVFYTLLSVLTCISAAYLAYAVVNKVV